MQLIRIKGHLYINCATIKLKFLKKSLKGNEKLGTISKEHSYKKCDRESCAWNEGWPRAAAVEEISCTPTLIGDGGFRYGRQRIFLIK